MLGGTRARLKRRRGRLAVVCAVVLLGATVATAHAGVATEHMGNAAVICLAVLAGGFAVAAVPALAGQRPRPPLQSSDRRTPPQLNRRVPYLARDDPALLQVFRR